MTISQAYKVLWSTGIVFVILPHLNLGLLSDYKICGDSECESLMSRVQAIRDHRSQDCRFLSFRRGDTIFVYHKLTGRRDDLWAGSIDRRFGYFPKEAVEEELVYATMEKVVETQKSDFFCMDEFGYPIDSSYLDSEEDYQKIPNQESETSPYGDDTVTESPPTSEDVSVESTVSAQEADATLTEEDEGENTGDTGRQDEEAPETPLDQQGGSAPSSWLGSSVTGWLGLSKEEEGEKRDESKEKQAEASVASSVTGWLGLGGAGKPHDDAVKEEETADSLASTMTGWLGFGGEKETDKEREEEEPAETFRSRRMSLNLEGSQLQEEERETETGTLGWLGNGLSSRLGFGRTNQEAGHETEREVKKEEEPASGSWFDIGVGDMLGFRKEKSKETEEQPTGSESVDPGQSRPAETEEGRTETSEEAKVEETPDTSGSSMDSVLPEDAKEIFPQIVESLEGEDHQMHDREPGEEEIKPAGDTDKDFLTQSDIDLGPDVSSVDLKQSVGEGEEDKTEEEEAEIQNQIDNTEEMSVKVGANSHEGEGIDAQADVLYREIQESQVSVGGKRRDKESETSFDYSDSVVFDTEIRETHQEAEGSSQGFGSSSSADKSTDMLYENASEDDRRTYYSSESTTQMGNKEDQDSVSPDMKHNDGEKEMEAEKEEEPKEEELEEVEEVNAQEKLQESEEEKQEENKELEGDVEEVKEEEKLEELEDVEEINAQEKLQEEPKEEEKQEEVEELEEVNAQEKVQESEEEKQDEIKEIEEEGKVEEVKEEEKHEELEDVEEINAQEKLQEEPKEEEKQEEVEELEEVNAQEKVQESEEEKQDEIKEIEEEGKVEEVKEEEKHEELEDVEEINAQEKLQETEEEKQDEEEGEVEEIKEEKEEKLGEEEELNEKRQEEVEVIEDEEKLWEVKEIMEEEKQEDVEELKEEEKQEVVEEIKEEETKDEIEEEKMQEKVEELMEKEKQRQIEELKEEKEVEVENSSPHIQKDGESESKEKSESVFFETSTQTENLQMDEEDREEEEVEVKQEMEDVEDEDRFVSDRDGNDAGNSLSSVDEEMVETEEQNPGLADRTGVREEEEERNEEEEQGEKKTTNESSQNNQPLLGQTAENKEDDQAENTEVSDDNELRQGDKTEPEDTETGSDERKTEQKHSDRNTEDKDVNTAGSEGETEVSVSSDDPVKSEQTRSERTAETEGAGAFGLFKNAFSYFSQEPVPKTEESTESAPSSDPNTVDTSKKQELDSTAAPDFHITESEPSPPLTSTQTPSHPTEPRLQNNTFTKHFQNLLAYMSAEETTVLTELFGRHKLQFLDYMIGTSETDDPENDESILLDIERLLHYHREVLFAPSMKLADAPQEDKERTRALIALQKLETLLEQVRETFITGDTKHEAEASSKDKEMSSEEDSSVGLDINILRDEWIEVDKEKDERLSKSTGKHERGGEKEQSEEERESSESHPHIQPEPQAEEDGMKQILDFVHQMAEDSMTQVHAVRELLIWLTVQVVSSLPDDIRPGPDLYGLPWEPVIISSVVGLVTMLLFTCRCYSSVKSRMYRSKERWMAEQVAQLLDEKCKVLETLSKCQQEYDELEDSLRDSGILAQTQKTEHLEVKARQLGHTKRELDRDIEQLKDQLEQQREHRMEQERRIAVLEESMKTFEEETKDLQSQEEQAQTTLKVYNMNSDRLQRNLETAGEENTLLQESNAQLRQQVEGWAERVSELEAEMSRCEVAHSAMLQDVSNKDERITSLTDRLLRMKGWDSDLEEEEGEEGAEKEKSNGTAGRGEENGRGDVADTQGHLQKVQKLIYAAKLNADLKSVDEDKDRLFAKLNDEVKAKEDLQVSIKELDNEKLSLQADAEQYSDQVQRLQQKLQIMTEMYQENELKLHRLLTVEEKERMQKEEKLNKADKNIALAMEELSNYRQRAGEMEEELEKTKQSYQTQISAHEKKAHNNWLAARAADRELADIRRENGLLRQKLTDTQFKLDALDKDPYALDSLARPLPFRAERSPYGPSPLGRPSSETRAFLSPPTLMDGPPARLSPRAPRGPVEPPGGPGEMERSGPHSDSGSISPTWERDRRGPPPGPPGPPGPLGPPGYMFPEPGGPMYRRPPPPPGALGLLPPPPGSLPPGPLHPRGLPPGPPHPADMADGSYRENSLGPADDHRESGDRRTPPDSDLRMGGPPPLGPPMGPMGPMGPMDGPFPRRAPYGPPPPDFYPPRGPGGPPMMPMWAPPPPGMMFPPRFPPGGPPLPPHPHYAPPMRPPLPDGPPHPSLGPPQQSLPSPPHSQQSAEEHTPSPEDAI